MKRIEITVPEALWEKIQKYRQLYRERVRYGKPFNMGVLLRSDLEVKLDESIRYLERLEVVKPKIGRPRTKNHSKNNK
jgi:hypothetical protein